MVDTMIRLFESTAVSFLSNGLGNLPDASKCEVIEERNGSFELELEYHVSGKRYPELRQRRIIVAKPNPYAAPQPFRIYYMSKPLNGLVTVKAEHISYDMSGYPVSPFKASNPAAALSGLKSHAIVGCPFEFATDMGNSGEMEVVKPDSMRALLGGSDGSILDVYGGEYEFDGHRVVLHSSRGANRGVTIRYGKNMTDLKQEENCSNVYTAVYPFWYSEEWGLIELPEKTVPTPGNHNYVRIYPLDLSNEWENSYEWEDQYPSEDEIRELANKYITDNKLGAPAVSLAVSFEQLSQAREYAALKLLETVRLCDSVNVEFPKLGVSAVSKCIKTTYNVLTGKYVSIELGESRPNLADSIASKNSTVDEKLSNRPTKSFMAQAVEKATLLISGGLGGYVIMRSSTGGEHPDEILIMDTPDIETATKVWRWNKGGLGYSRNGYNGPYETAITQDGEIVADFVKTGHLTANIIQGGTLTVGGVDNLNGKIEVRDANNNLLIKLGTNGIEFLGEGGSAVTQIVNSTLKTTNVTADNLKVSAANITGLLTADQINASNLKVLAANITGLLTADQINASNLKVLAANITGLLTADQINASNLKVSAANITGLLTADQINASNLKVSAANITGLLTADQINAVGLVAESFKYSDDDYTCSLSDGFLIKNKTENLSTSYSINGKQGSASLFANGLDFYTGTNFNGSRGSFWYDPNGFHLDKPLDIGTTSIRAGNDGNATIVDCTSNSHFYYGVSKEYADESSYSALRGKSVRIYSHKSGAVYLGSSGSTAVTSDENLKNIEKIDPRYEDFFMNLTPILYTYKNNGHRKHIGYGARSVEEALAKAGLTTEDFAGILIDKDVTIGADEMQEEHDVHFEELYSLRYEEFGPLYAHMLKKALAQIDGMQRKIDEMQQIMEELRRNPSST